MTLAETCNIGAYLAVKAASTPVASTAGAEAAITGLTIDRLALGQYFRSAVIIVHAHDLGNTIADGDDVKITLKVEESDDNFSTRNDYVPPRAASATIADDERLFLGTATHGTKAYAVDLSEAKRYIRIEVTPNFSAANTDTVDLSSFWVFGGADQVPTTLNA